MKTRIFIITTTLMLVSIWAKAQVKDISFTLSPAAEYTWWDDKSGLDDAVLVGGKLGFGFGEYLELRAIYFQSLDMQTNFQDFGLENYDSSLFNPQDISLMRYGGEFKANLGTNRLNPYITLGAGVQNIDVQDTGDFEQVYGSLGLGVKFNIMKRFVFSLEAKNTTYRFNSGQNLLSADDKMDFGVTDADFENERLSNWSIQGSLQFYLGGRKPGVMSDLDKAYLQKFKGGFSGLQLIIEPSVGYLNFDDNSSLRDTFLLGGFAGVDFNEYIGVRGFYFQASNDETVSTDFDDLAMYGIEFRARLNDGNGVTPFLILGGGYLNPYDSYVTSSTIDTDIVPAASVQGSEFATGGLGLNIPLGRNILISGGARAMITSGQNVTDINTTDDIQTNFFYNAGLKFTLGKKSESPNEVYAKKVDEALLAQQYENDERLKTLEKEYKKKINTLEAELKQAYAEKDVDKAVLILEEKKVVEEALQEVKEIKKVQEEIIIEQSMDTLNINAEKKNPIIRKSVSDMSTDDDALLILRQEYELKISGLERELNEAYLAKDTEKAAQLINEIKIAQDYLDVLKVAEQNEQPAKTTLEQTKAGTVIPNPILNTEPKLIKMTPLEFELLVDRLMKEVDETPANQNQRNDQVSNQAGTEETEILKERMAKMEKMLLEINDKKQPKTSERDSSGNNNEMDEKMVEASEKIIDRLDDLQKQMDKNTRALNNDNGNNETIVVTPSNDGQVKTIITKVDENGNVIETEEIIGDNPFLSYTNSSVLVGANTGGNTTFNFGARLHYNINNSPLQLMPEAVVGLGSKTTWGISGNIIYPLPVKNNRYQPYAGVGLGFGDLDVELEGFYNVVIGTTLPFLNNKLSFDYTMRNSFNYNQFAVGYRLTF